MFDPSQQVTVRMGKISPQPDQRVMLDMSFFLKDSAGFNQEARVTLRLEGDYKLSELRNEAIQKGRELLSQLASRPLDASPEQ